jgi:hypothetical protein
VPAVKLSEKNMKKKKLIFFASLKSEPELDSDPDPLVRQRYGFADPLHCIEARLKLVHIKGAFMLYRTGNSE